jgi:soluble cytochrome b562
MATQSDDDDSASGPTAIHKVDDLAEGLDDLSVTVDEIKDDPGGIDEGKLDEVKGALDRATDVVDDIENDDAD